MIEGTSIKAHPLATRTNAAIGSVDELATHLSARGADVKITPISREPTLGSTTVLNLGSYKIEFSSWQNARVSGGIADNSFSLGLFYRSNEANILWNKELNPGSLVCVPPGSERDAVYSDQIEVAIIHVPAETFESWADARGIGEGAKFMREPSFVCLPKPMAKRLAASMRQARTTLSNIPENHLYTRTFGFAFEHFLDTFMHCANLALRTGYNAHEVSIGHTALVKRAECLLNDKPGEVYLVNQLCERLRVSRRTLHRAFIDVLGVSPRFYMRNWRLTRAHEQLCKKRCNSVTEVAMNWGFFDLGRFSNGYAELFGELPSQTHNKH